MAGKHVNESTRVTDFFAQSLAEDESLTKKQQQILLAALNLFSDKGFDRTTTADIAQRAGVAEGTVYKRYKTKQELLNAIMTLFVTRVVPRTASEFGRTDWGSTEMSLHELLTTVIENRIDFIVANYRQLKIMLGEVLNNAPMRDRILVLVKEDVFGVMLPRLQHLRASHQIVDWPDDMLVQFIGGTLFALAIRLMMDMPVQSLPDQKQKIVQFLERGLGMETERSAPVRS